MKSIQVLSPQVSNRIAAGEVVERPSSVVKELVENAIDAGATAITVEIENGGIDYIRVSDNGSGIPAEDCATAFLRHATSKIETADDIARISTLGFRGEALPSIASVSEVTLKTRTASAESGTLLRIDNGEFLEQVPVACPEGTVFEVRNLFAKTPARLKFLKNPRTEAGYIGDYLSRMIMAMPEISFVYVNNGKTVYRTYGDGTLKNAVFSIYGSSVLPQLRDVFYDDGYIRINGYVGTPAISRPNRLQQSLYLNGRYIRSHSVSNAVLRAYDTRLMVGKFPFFILFIRIAGSEVDINVHPTKMEVRFADDRRVCAAVYSACVRTLEQPSSSSAKVILQQEDASIQHVPLQNVNDITSEADRGSDVSDIEATQKASKPIQPLHSEYEKSVQEPELRTAMPTSVSKVQETAHSTSVYVPQKSSHGISYCAPKPTPSIPIFEIVSNTRQKEQVIDKMQPEEPVRFGVDDYRIIGATFMGYWLVEQGETLFFIDQHAAHERRLYEDLMSRRIEPASQALFVPECLRFSPAEFSVFEEHREEVTAFGFTCQATDLPFEVQVSAVPCILGVTLSPSSLREALQLLIENGELQGNMLLRSSLIQTACKHAIKVNERISAAEIQHLLAEFACGKIPMTCPHGRPVMVQLSKLDIEKMFKRVL